MRNLLTANAPMFRLEQILKANWLDFNMMVLQAL